MFYETEMLLPYTWDPIEHVNVNELLVISERPLSYWKPVINTSNQYEEVYKISFSDGASTLVTKDHIFNTKRFGLQQWEEKTVEELITFLNNHPVNIPPVNLYCCFGSCTYNQDTVPPDTIEVSTIDYPLNFFQQDLRPLPPYWLGVLTMRGLLNREEPLGVLDPELVNIMAQSEYGYNRHRVIEPPLRELDNEDDIYKFFSYESTGNRSQLSLDLENLELLYTDRCNRLIHPSYLFTDYHDRLQLLKGLMDAAGFLDLITGIAKIRIYSQQLVDDIFFLVRSMGGWVNIKPAGGGTYWLLDIYMQTSPFSRPGLASQYKPINAVPPRYIESIELVDSNGSVHLIDIGLKEPFLISKSASNNDFIVSK